MKDLATMEMRDSPFLGKLPKGHLYKGNMGNILQPH